MTTNNSSTYNQSISCFNTVDHNLLFDVLQGTFGITNTALNWYKNYLKPRTFKVCINGSYLSEQIMDIGLPKDPLKVHTYSTALPQHCPKLNQAH